MNNKKISEQTFRNAKIAAQLDWKELSLNEKAERYNYYMGEVKDDFAFLYPVQDFIKAVMIYNDLDIEWCAKNAVNKPDDFTEYFLLDWDSDRLVYMSYDEALEYLDRFTDEIIDDAVKTAVSSQLYTCFNRLDDYADPRKREVLITFE